MRIGSGKQPTRKISSTYHDVAASAPPEDAALLGWSRSFMFQSLNNVSIILKKVNKRF